MLRRRPATAGTGRTPVGAIAGRCRSASASSSARWRSPHDGTVSVEETRLPGLADHCMVPATHTGLVFSDEAANQTVAFLRTARFAHTA